MPKVLSIILGGGKGTRLYPLTQSRSKPAVPFGGKHRIVDIPISNCINSGLRQIYVLTQFNSASLHLHIARAYRFDSFSNGFVEILAAEQTFEHSGWYEGTADAVRKNFTHFKTQNPKYYIILSGDQLYRMNLQDFLAQHEASGADITIACTAVNRRDASGFGIMQIDKKSNITAFMEKPGPDRNIDEWKIPAQSGISVASPDKEYLASMGIYIFNAKAMEECLNNSMTDFGKEIIPASIKDHKVSAFVHNGYWEDIGTIRSQALLERVQQLGSAWSRQLAAVDGVDQVRGRGLLLGVGLEDGLPPAAEIAAALAARGFIVNAPRPDTIRLAPPFILSDDDARAFTTTLSEVLARAQSEKAGS